MSGRVEPPDGTPEGAPGGGDDEYRSLVFDESFIKAARLQEFSAQERLEDEEHAAVRSRPVPALGSRTGLGFSRQGLVLVLLIVLAFGTAIYMGIRNPYQTPPKLGSEPMRSEILPLAPRGKVPGAAPADLFEHSPAAQFRAGADGVALPPVRRSEHFSESQVLAALTTAKDYVVESSLDPNVLTGEGVRRVRLLLNTRQQDSSTTAWTAPATTGGTPVPPGWSASTRQDGAGRPSGAGQRHPRRPRGGSPTRWRSSPTTCSSTRYAPPTRARARTPNARRPSSPYAARCASTSTPTTCATTS